MSKHPLDHGKELKESTCPISTQLCAARVHAAMLRLVDEKVVVGIFYIQL